MRTGDAMRGALAGVAGLLRIHTTPRRARGSSPGAGAGDHMLRLAGIAAAAALLCAGAARAECPAGAPSGLYEGSTLGAPALRIEITLNLVCAEDSYQARVFSSIGDLPVRELKG